MTSGSVPERDRLYQLFLGVLERLLRLLEREGDYPGAICTRNVYCVMTRCMRQPIATSCACMQRVAIGLPLCGPIRAALPSWNVNSGWERALQLKRPMSSSSRWERYGRRPHSRNTYPREEAQKRQKGMSSEIHRCNAASAPTYGQQRCKEVSPLRRVERRTWISKAGHLYVLRRANQNGCGAMVSRKREATTCAG